MESERQTGGAATGSGGTRLLLGLGLVLIAFNLRPVFSSVSVLLPEILSSTGLSGFGAGLLVTLPVVCLGLFAPVAPWLAQRIGAERTFMAMLLVLALGTAIRGFGTVPLFVGQTTAGACIAVGNVLLPGLVKRDFPDRVPLMTGLYTMALCGGAAVAAGLTVPLQDLLGRSWPAALAAWALPAGIAAAVWLPQASGHGARSRPLRVNVVGLWRDPLAWQVTLFMGLQSSLAYTVFGWLAPILRERGFDAVSAGAVVSADVLVQVASCLVTPAVAMRCRDQRGVNVFLAACAAGALIGFVFAPPWLAWPLAIVQGVGQGGLIASAITMIVLRSPDSQVAAHLSGMAQCVGYLLASIAPLVIGIIHGLTGGFTAAAGLIAFIGLLLAGFGLGAGRTLHVRAHTVPR